MYLFDPFIILGCVTLVAFIVLFMYTAISVNRERNRVQAELSGEDGVFTGLTGEPKWNGKLPESVDDYTEPRYVFENLVESSKYLTGNGRVIGYRISPSLVIHSTIMHNIPSSALSQYIDRLGGKLPTVEEADVLRESLDKISLLQSALDEEAIGVKWFWVTHNGVPIISHYKNPEFRNVIGFNTGHTLILKR